MVCAKINECTGCAASTEFISYLLNMYVCLKKVTNE